MKSTLIVIAASALLLGGCSSYSRTDRALGGGAIGAAAGTAIGAAASGTVGGAVAGGIIGGAAGAILGASTTPRACYTYDRYGRRIAVQCP
jgi:hypothetical protein